MDKTNITQSATTDDQLSTTDAESTSNDINNPGTPGFLQHLQRRLNAMTIGRYQSFSFFPHN